MNLFIWTSVNDRGRLDRAGTLLVELQWIQMKKKDRKKTKFSIQNDLTNNKNEQFTTKKKVFDSDLDREEENKRR